MAIEAHATARFVRTSAQKAGLVMDLIRGRDVNRALATLQFTRKGVSHDIAKLLRSAIANAQQKDGFGGDVDRLYVSACYANQGPSMKRIRPAPMGRAFRVVKRTAHLTVQVTERPVEITAVGATPTPKRGSAKAGSAKAAGKENAGGTKASGTAKVKAAPAAETGEKKQAPARKKSTSAKRSTK